MTQTNDDEDEKNEDEDDDEEQEVESRAFNVIKTTREKLRLEDEQFKSQHVFPIKRRAHSQRRALNGKYTRGVKLLDEEENQDVFIAMEHPTNAYKKYIRLHASKDFALLKQESKGDEKLFEHLKRKSRPKIHMRVRSQGPSYTSTKMRMELKPKSNRELQEVVNLNFNIRLVTWEMPATSTNIIRI